MTSAPPPRRRHRIRDAVLLAAALAAIALSAGRIGQILSARPGGAPLPVISAFSPRAAAAFPAPQLVTPPARQASVPRAPARSAPPAVITYQPAAITYQPAAITYRPAAITYRPSLFHRHPHQAPARRQCRRHQREY